jgi:hypothetical protein
VCKPVIRKSAKVGDLVIGCLGKELAQDNAFEHRSIRYCAEVANTMTLQEYAREFPNRADNIFQADTMELNDNGRELSGDTTTGFADRVNKADRVLIFHKDVHWLEGRNVSIEPLLFGKKLCRGQIKNSRNEEFEKAYVACIGPDRDEHEPTSEVVMSDSSSDGEMQAMDAEGEGESESRAHSGPADGAVGESPAEESPTGPPRRQRSEVADDAAMTAEDVAASEETSDAAFEQQHAPNERLEHQGYQAGSDLPADVRKYEGGRGVREIEEPTDDAAMATEENSGSNGETEAEEQLPPGYHYEGGRDEHGKQHGWGKFITPVGTYEGNYEHGETHGEGTLTSANGTIYEGNWEHGDVRRCFSFRSITFFAPPERRG